MRVPDSEIDFTPEFVYTYRGELLTGVAYEEDPDLGLSEVSYVGGAQHGWARDHDPAGRLRGETLYYENVRHGPERVFDEEGRLVSEDTCLYGYLARSRRRNEAGELAETFILDQGSQQAGLIEHFRGQLAWPEDFGV